mmetsp:Transcript_9234/g.37983  ORF Transcript_9234/g.37983 Transcript_9234/m.37983 type:complete len:280 (+) Transcript_9234:1375-2214(+)
MVGEGAPDVLGNVARVYGGPGVELLVASAASLLLQLRARECEPQLSPPLERNALPDHLQHHCRVQLDELVDVVVRNEDAPCVALLLEALLVLDQRRLVGRPEAVRNSEAVAVQPHVRGDVSLRHSERVHELPLLLRRRLRQRRPHSPAPPLGSHMLLQLLWPRPRLLLPQLWLWQTAPPQAHQQRHHPLPVVERRKRVLPCVCEDDDEAAAALVDGGNLLERDHRAQRRGSEGNGATEADVAAGDEQDADGHLALALLVHAGEALDQRLWKGKLHRTLQ